MAKAIVWAAAAALLAPAAAPGAERAEDAVKAVVQSAYVEGVHARGDAALMRAGFHPDFRMLVLKDGAMSAVTLDEWAARIEKGARERAASARPEIRAEFPRVHVTRDAAQVQVELFRAGKHVFTDYLTLYRFADGWKIVSKIFQAHP
jgi:ketosteroid isomerase-like protein